MHIYRMLEEPRSTQHRQEIGLPAQGVLHRQSVFNRALNRQRVVMVCAKGVICAKPPQRATSKWHMQHLPQVDSGRRNDSTIRASASMSRLHSTESPQAYPSRKHHQLTKADDGTRQHVGIVGTAL